MDRFVIRVLLGFEGEHYASTCTGGRRTQRRAKSPQRAAVQDNVVHHDSGPEARQQGQGVPRQLRCVLPQRP